MIYLLIPTYNESLNIQRLYNELSFIKLDEELHFVFSDDGSNDNTIELIQSIFEQKNTTILKAKQNAGPGNAFNSGFEWILENSMNITDRIVTMEADCTSDISILTDLLSINKLGYDLVLASVYAQGGGFSKTSFFRKLLSSIANLFFRFAFNVKVLTLSSFYRVYSVDLIRKVKLNHPQLIKEKGFICMLEILLKCIEVNAKIIEVPMILNSDKRVGKSKMKIFKTSITYFKFLFRYKFKK
jgi:dolichol-phosphate mannosyltransferase